MSNVTTITGHPLSKEEITAKATRTMISETGHPLSNGAITKFSGNNGTDLSTYVEFLDLCQDSHEALENIVRLCLKVNSTPEQTIEHILQVARLAVEKQERIIEQSELTDIRSKRINRLEVSSEAACEQLVNLATNFFEGNPPIALKKAVDILKAPFSRNRKIQNYIIGGE